MIYRAEYDATTRQPSCDSKLGWKGGDGNLNAVDYDTRFINIAEANWTQDTTINGTSNVEFNLHDSSREKAPNGDVDMSELKISRKGCNAIGGKVVLKNPGCRDFKPFLDLTGFDIKPNKQAPKPSGTKPSDTPPFKIEFKTVYNRSNVELAEIAGGNETLTFDLIPMAYGNNSLLVSRMFYQFFFWNLELESGNMILLFLFSRQSWLLNFLNYNFKFKTNMMII